jgi:hypothetical protein
MQRLLARQPNRPRYERNPSIIGNGVHLREESRPRVWRVRCAACFIHCTAYQPPARRPTSPGARECRCEVCARFAGTTRRRMGSKADPVWGTCTLVCVRHSAESSLSEKGRFGALYASYVVTIGDDSHVAALTQAFAGGIERGGFLRAYRPADTDFNSGVWHMESPRSPSLSSSPVGKGLGRGSHGALSSILHPRSPPLRGNVSFETADCTMFRAAWRECRTPELRWTDHPSSAGECHQR